MIGTKYECPIDIRGGVNDDARDNQDNFRINQHNLDDLYDTKNECLANTRCEESSIPLEGPDPTPVQTLN